MKNRARLAGVLPVPRQTKRLGLPNSQFLDLEEAKRDASPPLYLNGYLGKMSDL
jgi:hypothetical protein